MTSNGRAAGATPRARDTGLPHYCGDDLPLLALLETQGEIVDLMAKGAELSEVLARIATNVERLSPETMCSILLLKQDGLHLRPAAAPSLPKAFYAAIEGGLEIGPSCGSCGTAAYIKAPVIVRDIATDPLWAGPRDFALSFGLRACWSLPIMTDEGVVLGTIAMYYREPRAPTGLDWGLLVPAAKLVRMALAQARREEALKESEARWQFAAMASGLGTYDVDLMTEESVWSPRLKAILGVPDDAPATYETFAGRIHPDDLPHYHGNRITERIEPGTDLLRDLEVRIVRANDGEERIIALKGRLSFNNEGVPARAIGTIADVTDVRRYEHNLAAAKIAAEEANMAKSNFLAAMSHELRTPLNAIIGFSDFIRQCTLGPLSPAKYREYVDDIYKSGNHLLSLINDVLDMAKIEAGKHQLEREDVLIGAAAAEAMVFVEPQCKAAGIVPELRIGNGLALSADRRALVQILTNLLSNAVKFTKPGGRVTVFADVTSDGGIAVGVEDTGIGMSAQDLATAIEPFGQAQRMSTVDGRGTGLGLPLVKSLIEGHGAHFRIESNVGEGTRVWGEFPASAVSARRAVA